MQRPFASGSRQAPDPYDQYLEQNGFYRKHTARDSSCLFRTISEQMYDTQLHHLTIRQFCVDYMRKYKEIFQKNVDRDIDEYLDEMSKPKTFGTLLELRAVSYLYRRNIILFEAYNTGTYMVEEKDFNNVFRIFFTPEKHFDSVFTTDFIEVAAFCQSICYEILYKHVFKLPDVTYAVERMLHACSLESVAIQTEYDGPYATKITLEDGRNFQLNRPDDTRCILENYILCHFHNSNFTQFADNLHHDMQLVETSVYDNHKVVSKTLDSLLPEKFVSCVRQLLKEGITPFPYKVAKALDPDIYRNIEFDAWSELRKEQRFKNWYTGGSNFQVGVKCLVKLRNSQNSLFNCHIQEMSPDKGPCLVYVEELGQKHMVPYDNLQPLPKEQAKPWPLPFRFQKHIENHPKGVISELKKSHGNGKKKLRDVSSNYRIISTLKKEIISENEVSAGKDDISYKLKQYTSIQHFYPQTFEFMAMPLTVDHCANQNGENRNSRRNSDNSVISHATSTDVTKHEAKKEDDSSELEYAPPIEHYPYNYGYPEPYYPLSYDNNIIPSNSHGPYYCMYNGQPFAPSNGVVAHSVYVPPPLHCAQQSGNNYFQTYCTVPPSTSTSTGVSSAITTTTNVINRRCEPANGNRINLLAGRSVLASGSDLPTDIPTLRFFYNLGYEYYKQMHPNTTESITEGSEKCDAVNKLSGDFQSTVKIENDTTHSSSNQDRTKIDQNNNTSTTTNQNHHQNPRRFTSRSFNSRREKSNYRVGNANNNNNNHRFQNNNNNDYNKNFNTKNNATSSASTNNNNVNNSKVSTTTPSSSNDQGIQINSSCSSSLANSDAWVNDFPQTPPLCSTQPHVPFAPFVSFYPEADQQANMFVQPPVVPVPYGMYPPPPPAIHSGGYQTYMTPTGAQSMPMSTTFPHSQSYISQGNESSSVDPVDNGHYTIMGYSPIFYSPSGTNGANTITTQSVPQGFPEEALCQEFYFQENGFTQILKFSSFEWKKILYDITNLLTMQTYWIPAPSAPPLPQVPSSSVNLVTSGANNGAATNFQNISSSAPNNSIPR